MGSSVPRSVAIFVGCTTSNTGWHPVWAVYPVREAQVDLDWGAVYGPEWAVMQGAIPVSTVLAVGSAIAVYPKGQLATA